MNHAATLPRAARRPWRFSPARVGVYAFLITAAAFFLMPLYIMLVTSFKTMDEIRLGNIFAFPVAITVEPWVTAWTSACRTRCPNTCWTGCRPVRWSWPSARTACWTMPACGVSPFCGIGIG